MQKEIQELFAETNREFTAQVKKADWYNDLLMQNGYDPTDHISYASEHWAKAGFGDTADEAGLAARYMRGTSDAATVGNFNQVEQHFKNSFHSIAEQRQNLETSFRATAGKFKALMETVPGTQLAVPQLEVFKILRKTSDNAVIIRRIKLRFGVNIGDTDATALKKYFQDLDGFSPGIYVGKRESSILGMNHNGALTMDFEGLGAENIHAVAKAMARSSVESPDVRQAIIQVRGSEADVTARFKAKQNSITGALEHHAERIQFSGDDGNLLLRAKPSVASIDSIVSDLARNPDGAAVRSVVIGPTSNVTIASDLSTHGETVLKAMKESSDSLEGVVPHAILKGLVMTADMTQPSTIRLVFALSNDSRMALSHLPVSERSQFISRVEQAFLKALKVKEIEDFHYQSGGVRWVNPLSAVPQGQWIWEKYPTYGKTHASGLSWLAISFTRARNGEGASSPQTLVISS